MFLSSLVAEKVYLVWPSCRDSVDGVIYGCQSQAVVSLCGPAIDISLKGRVDWGFFCRQR